MKNSVDTINKRAGQGKKKNIPIKYVKNINKYYKKVDCIVLEQFD